MAKKSQAGATLTRGEVQRIEVLDTAEVQLVQLDGAAITRWVESARAFFQRATELELRAKSYLQRADTIKVPTNGDQDAQLQDLIRLGNAEKKENEAHWTIAGVLDKLHKRAVQGRRRGSDAYDQATTILNQRHNQYVDAERRRAEEESNRLRREAEDRARRDRQAQLDRLEQEALKAEAESPDLSLREQEFVQVHFRTGNATTAARMAGYKNPDNTAMRLLGMEKIRKALKALDDAKVARQQAEALKAAPVEVESTITEVRPDTRGGDRTTWSMEIIDEVACRNAAFEGRHGIPRDLFRIDPAKGNEYARSMHENLDRWPGCRAKKTTRVI